MRNILVGADPEMMVVEKNLRQPVPVTGLIGGTKEHPIAVACGAVQEDNVNAEFNIDPAKSEQEFIRNLRTVMGILESMLPGEFCLEARSSARFAKQVLKDAGPEVMRFGCSPDYNALTREENHIPSSMTTLRTAGGHVHIGWDNPAEEDKWAVGVACDYLLGLWSVVEDGDDERRQMYGKAGAVRVKDYGVEYRVMSNFWLRDGSTMSEVYRRAVLAASNVHNLPRMQAVISPEDVQAIINSGDRVKAKTALAAVEGVL